MTNHHQPLPFTAKQAQERLREWYPDMDPTQRARIFNLLDCVEDGLRARTNGIKRVDSKKSERDMQD